jgi:hypothetical protein
MIVSALQVNVYDYMIIYLLILKSKYIYIYKKEIGIYREKYNVEVNRIIVYDH